MSVRSMSPRRRTDPFSVLHVHVRLLWFIPRKGVAEELLCPRSKILGPCPGKLQTVCENAFSVKCTEYAIIVSQKYTFLGCFSFSFLSLLTQRGRRIIVNTRGITPWYHP